MTDEKQKQSTKEAKQEYVTKKELYMILDQVEGMFLDKAISTLETVKEAIKRNHVPSTISLIDYINMELNNARNIRNSNN